MVEKEIENMLSKAGLEDAVASEPFYRFTNKGWKKETVYLPTEMQLSVCINGKELLVVSCSPVKLQFLVFGFLYSEGIISDLKDVAFIRLCRDEAVADVRLNREFEPPERRTLTSDCGGTLTFKSRVEKVTSEIRMTPTELFLLMKEFRKRMLLYRASGSVHTAALSDTKRILVTAEDIGRHNTLDKILGGCLLEGIPTEGKILLCTGRISSSMLVKAARMDVPLVVSQRLPTRDAVSLARELSITVVGRARASRFSVYSHPERIVSDSENSKIEECRK